MMPMLPPSAGPTGPASVPTENPGLMADAMTKVREAINLLEVSLPGLPIGTDVHKSVVSAISALSKEVPASQAVPGVQMATLQNLGQDAQQSQMLKMLMAQVQPQGGAPGAGAPPGAMPPPGM